MGCRVCTRSAALSKCSLLLASLVLLHHLVGSQAERGKRGRADQSYSGVARLQQDYDYEAHKAKLTTAKICTKREILENNIANQQEAETLECHPQAFLQQFEYLRGDCDFPRFPGLPDVSYDPLDVMLTEVEDFLHGKSDIGVTVFVGSTIKTASPPGVKVIFSRYAEDGELGEDGLPKIEDFKTIECNGGEECFFPLQYPSTDALAREILTRIVNLNAKVRLSNCICYTCFPAFYYLSKAGIEVHRCARDLNQGKGHIFNTLQPPRVREEAFEFADTCTQNFFLREDNNAAGRAAQQAATGNGNK